MRNLPRLLPSFLVTWLLTFTLASLFHSQYVVNQLANLGIVVTFSDRVSMSIDDWLGLLPTYGAIIAIAFALALSCAAWIFSKLQHARTALFICAGLSAFLLVLLALESIMNIHLIAGARGWGLYAQLAVGGFGGFVFSLLSRQVTHAPA